MSGIEYFETKTSQCRGHVPGHEPKDCACKTEYRFRVRAANGEIVAQSEGYTTKQACREGATALGIAILAKPAVLELIIDGFLKSELEMLAMLERGIIDKGDLLAIREYLEGRRAAIKVMGPPQVLWTGETDDAG